jgi:hypothetical protein
MLSASGSGIGRKAASGHDSFTPIHTLIRKQSLADTSIAVGKYKQTGT